MKRVTDKAKKQQVVEQVRAGKAACGTLQYLAECRGCIQKAEVSRWTKPPDSASWTERK